VFVRMGSFRVASGKLEELRRVYLGECAPIVKKALGNLDCCLLESATEPESVAAWTVWETEAHAREYEASGTAQAVVGKVKHLFASAPTLQSYRIRREPGVTAAATP
jgi:heme-degrading monooxygenase HmoA